MFVLVLEWAGRIRPLGVKLGLSLGRMEMGRKTNGFWKEWVLVICFDNFRSKMKTKTKQK